MPSTKDHQHAAFTQNFIEAMKKQQYSLVGCEIMYNHYGDRGVIDVVLRKDYVDQKRSTWLICEMKPRLYDIGETIRQVHRAEEYFCRARPDMKMQGWENEYRFILVLEADKQNLHQVQCQHRDLFAGIDVMYHHSDSHQIDAIERMSEIMNAILTVQNH